jgi:hypothetical protein
MYIKVIGSNPARFSRVYTIDILVNLDGEQIKMFGGNLCAFCVAAVPREMYFIEEP